MQDEKIEWQWDLSPPIIAWYAVIYSWDSDDGDICYGVAHWEGGEWYENLPIVAWAGPFNSVEDAEIFSNCCDPDYPKG